MGTAKGDGYTVTPRDLELVVNAINCTRLPFELDYDKLARRLGYKNAQSAKAAWNALKKKLDKVAEGAPVVPSLTIEPEPLRLPLGSASSSKDAADTLSAKKKGKQPARERDASSETSGDESMETPVRKSKKKSRSKPSKQVRSVDDGDVSMGEEDPRQAKTSKKKSIKKISDGGPSTSKDADTRGKKRRRVAVETSSSASSPSSSSLSENEDAPSQEPRQKLKRKATTLAIRDCLGQGGGKSGSPFAGKLDKAFEAYGRRGAAAAAGDEDDEEAMPDPPPAYVKRESDSGGEL